MTNNILIVVLLSLTHISFSQDFIPNKVFTSIDKNLLIYPIQRVKNDSVNNLIFVQITDTSRVNLPVRNLPLSKILCFNMDGKLIWKKNSYPYDFNILAHKKILYFNGRSICIDISTGKKLWTSDSKVFYYNKNKDFVACASNNTLEIINISDGKTISKKSIVGRTFSIINDVRFTNDSLLIFSGDGLIILNMKKNRIYSYEAKYYSKSFNYLEAYNLIGIASGLLTGFFFYSIHEESDFDIYSSNICVDSNLIFSAGYDRILAINKNSFKVSWNYQFDNKNLNISTLFPFKNYLIQYNSGIAQRGKSLYKTLLPSISVFDKYSGQQIVNFPMQNASLAQGISALNDIVIINTNNKNYKLHFSDDKIRLQE